jgi:hypothetical protein
MRPTKIKIMRCARCRDELSTAEKLGGKGSLCAFCTHMYAEALDICQHIRKMNALSIAAQTTA